MNRYALLHIIEFHKNESILHKLDNFHKDFLFFVLGLIMLAGGIKPVTLGIAGIFMIVYGQLLPSTNEKGEALNISLCKKKLYISGIISLFLSAAMLFAIFYF